MAIIDLIPNIHRTPALAMLRRAVVEGRPATFRLTADEKELAFHDASVQLTSPIGARVLRALYDAGQLKLKKQGPRALPALDAYIATEPAFRAEVARIIAADQAMRLRLAEIIADPSCARPDEITPFVIDRVIAARLGHDAYGSLTIAGLTCHRDLHHPAPTEEDRFRPEGRVICWWTDAAGQRQGDTI